MTSLPFLLQCFSSPSFVFFGGGSGAVALRVLGRGPRGPSRGPPGPNFSFFCAPCFSLDAPRCPVLDFTGPFCCCVHSAVWSIQ